MPHKTLRTLICPKSFCPISVYSLPYMRYFIFCVTLFSTTIHCFYRISNVSNIHYDFPFVKWNKNCSNGRTRTFNHRLNRAPLCQLSYTGIFPCSPAWNRTRISRASTERSTTELQKIRPLIEVKF